jgi:hypothetical protein
VEWVSKNRSREERGIYLRKKVDKSEEKVSTSGKNVKKGGFAKMGRRKGY